MASKNLTAVDQALTIGGAAGEGRARTVAFQLAGTFTGTVTFESTVDGTNWVATGAYPISGSGTAATTATAVGIWRVPAAALSAVRARCSAFTSGTIEVKAETSEGVF